MTDTSRDDVTSNDLRERLERAIRECILNGNPLSEDIADALLPVVAEHTAREVQTARAEQREQIVAALEQQRQPGRDAITKTFNNALHRAADIVSKVGQP